MPLASCGSLLEPECTFINKANFTTSLQLFTTSLHYQHPPSITAADAAADAATDAAVDAATDAAADAAALVAALATSSDFLELMTPASRPRAPPARSGGWSVLTASVRYCPDIRTPSRDGRGTRRLEPRIFDLVVSWARHLASRDSGEVLTV